MPVIMYCWAAGGRNEAAVHRTSRRTVNSALNQAIRRRPPGKYVPSSARSSSATPQMKPHFSRPLCQRLESVIRRSDFNDQRRAAAVAARPPYAPGGGVYAGPRPVLTFSPPAGARSGEFSSRVFIAVSGRRRCDRRRGSRCAGVAVRAKTADVGLTGARRPTRTGTNTKPFFLGDAM